MFCTLLALFVAATCAVPTAPAAEPEMLYVGTYSGKDSLGIYLFAMDAETGGLEPRGLAAEARHASFLCVAPRRRTVYAVSEVGTYEGQASGSVSAFAIDPATHRLTLLNRQASGGPGTCFVSTDPDEAFVLAANFSGGSVRLFPVRDDGSLGAGASVQRHAPGVDAQGRPTKPFAHSIVVDPTGRFVLGSIRGHNSISVLAFDEAARKLTAVGHVTDTIDKPRNFVIHPSGRFVLVGNQRSGTITVFRLDPQSGALTRVGDPTPCPSPRLPAVRPGPAVRRYHVSAS